MATANEYAQWIVDNQDKKGTPEFETVAQAYQLSKQQSAQQSAPKEVSASDRFIQGMKDPIEGGAQFLTHALPEGMVNAGNTLNNWLADKTGLVGKLPPGGVDQQIKETNEKFKTNGIDGYRLAGNIFNPATLSLAAVSPATAAGSLATGVGLSLLNPVSDGNYGVEKLRQAGLATVLSAVPFAASRVVSPKASTNPSIKMLQKEGVELTPGQTMGDWSNKLEQRLTSIPVFGDMIASARNNSRETFNRAALNRALSPISQSSDDIGQVGVKKAGDLISNVYQEAKNQIKVVKFDPQFSSEYRQLHTMTRSLVPEMRKKFDDKVSSLFGTRMSPRGSMLPDAYKNVDSELGNLAGKYQGSTIASEKELGDAFAQLQSLVTNQARRNNPKAAELFDKADEAYANLVRVEGAAKSAKNSEGVFTPGQLNMAIQQADDSVRGRSVSRGTALMQDLGNAGQKVIGNTVPNSGTPERLLPFMTGGAALVDPVTTLSLIGGGSLAYTKPAQKALEFMLTRRPEAAQSVAKGILKSSPFIVPSASFGLLNQ